jgi:hypothetical protein
MKNSYFRHSSATIRQFYHPGRGRCQLHQFGCYRTNRMRHSAAFQRSLAAQPRRIGHAAAADTSRTAINLRGKAARSGGSGHAVWRSRVRVPASALRPGTGEIKRFPIERQTEIVIEQMELCLTAAGSSLDKVIKSTVYCNDPALFETINRV